MRGYRSSALMTVMTGVLLFGGFAACGNDGDDGGTATTTSSSTIETATTTTSTIGSADGLSSGDLPPSTAFSLDSRRTVKIMSPDGSVSYGDGPFDEAEFGAPTGSVEAVWYRVGDTWAVHFKGLSPEQASGKCLAVFQPFGSERSSPYGPGACDGVAAESLLPSGSLRLCGGDAIVLISNLTVAPPTEVGARIVQRLGDGESQEMWDLGEVGSVPTIDVSGCQTIS